MLQPSFRLTQLPFGPLRFPFESLNFIRHHTRPNIEPLLVKRRQCAPCSPRLGIARDVSEELEEGAVVGSNRVVIFTSLELGYSLLFPLMLFSCRRQGLGATCQMSSNCDSLPFIDAEGEPSS